MPAGDFFNGLFERFLNGAATALALPPGVGRAVVGESEFDGSQ